MYQAASRPDRTAPACNQAIIELAHGDREALSVIYDRMARLVFSVAYATTGIPADAEDGRQDTLFAVLRYASSYRDGSNAHAFVLTIARHLAIDVVRKRKATVPLDEIAPADQPVCETDWSRCDVRDLLAVLTEDERQLVVLRLYAGLGYRKISRVMEISVVAAQKRYQRALKKLKRLL